MLCVTFIDITFIAIYSETSKNQTLNKPKPCLNWTLYKVPMKQIFVNLICVKQIFGNLTCVKQIFGNLTCVKQIFGNLTCVKSNQISFI